MLILSFLLSTLHILGRHYGNAEADGPSRYGLCDSLYYVFGIFCQQGMLMVPQMLYTLDKFQLLMNQANSVHSS
jgi:hypothetical protein